MLFWGLFSAAIALRLAVAMAAGSPPVAPPLADDELPVYTVLVAMYREGAVIPKLVAALNRFDYPVLGSNLTSRPREVRSRFV